MNEKYQLLIGKILLAGLFISLALTLGGGVWYLFSNGGEIVNYQHFEHEPYTALITKIWQDALIPSAYGMIQAGILILVFTQFLRVALVSWYYFKLRDIKFGWLSLFIFAVLLFSLFWKA